jgi:hypothetical protein
MNGGLVSGPDMGRMGEAVRAHENRTLGGAAGLAGQGQPAFALVTVTGGASGAYYPGSVVFYRKSGDTFEAAPNPVLVKLLGGVPDVGEPYFGKLIDFDSGKAVYAIRAEAGGEVVRVLTGICLRRKSGSGSGSGSGGGDTPLESECGDGMVWDAIAGECVPDGGP